MPINKLQAARLRAFADPTRETMVAQAAEDPSFTSMKDNKPITDGSQGAPNNPVDNRVRMASAGTPSNQTLLIIAGVLVVGWLVVRNS